MTEVIPVVSVLGAVSSDLGIMHSQEFFQLGQVIVV